MASPASSAAELPWIARGRSYIGEREIKGPKHNPKLVRLWDLARTDFTDDETPWCSGYVCGVLEEEGIVSARTGWARGNLRWGHKLDGPAYGAIAILSRGANSGHVAFVVGRDRGGNLMLLGGNQSDAVNIKPFSRDRVLGYRWPKEMLAPAPEGAGVPGILAPPAAVGFSTLPVLRSDGKLSTNEA